MFECFQDDLVTSIAKGRFNIYLFSVVVAIVFIAVRLTYCKKTAGCKRSRP